MTRRLAEEVGKRDPFRSKAQEVFLNLSRTGQHLDAPFKTLFRSHGLSPTTYNLLCILRGHRPKGCRCTTLRDELVVRVPDVTRLVDRLCDAGLVVRTPDADDARAVLVRITPVGLKMLEELDEPVLELHEQQLGHMSTEELSTLSDLLERARSDEADSTGT